jgi:hypothetical protein
MEVLLLDTVIYMLTLLLEIYSFILNIFMALIDKVLSKQVDPNQLTKDEIHFLLELIKRSSFQGESLEGLYNLVLKLQNQFISLDK